jgi:hypothetical protein
LKEYLSPSIWVEPSYISINARGIASFEKKRWYPKEVSSSSSASPCNAEATTKVQGTIIEE